MVNASLRDAISICSLVSGGCRTGSLVIMLPSLKMTRSHSNSASHCSKYPRSPSVVWSPGSTISGPVLFLSMMSQQLWRCVMRTDRCAPSHGADSQNQTTGRISRLAKSIIAHQRTQDSSYILNVDFAFLYGLRSTKRNK